MRIIIYLLPKVTGGRLSLSGWAHSGLRVFFLLVSERQLFFLTCSQRCLKWIMLQKFQGVMHYLDDFFGMFANTQVADEFDTHFDEICRDLGLIVNQLGSGPWR